MDQRQKLLASFMGQNQRSEGGSQGGVSQANRGAEPKGWPLDPAMSSLSMEGFLATFERGQHSSPMPAGAQMMDPVLQVWDQGWQVRGFEGFLLLDLFWVGVPLYWGGLTRVLQSWVCVFIEGFRSQIARYADVR